MMTDREALRELATLPTSKPSGDKGGEYVALGGTRIYSDDPDHLDLVLGGALLALEELTNRQPSTDRGWLHALSKNELGISLNKRLMGALLGRLVGTGRVTPFLCAAESGARFRVFCHPLRAKAFEERVGRFVSELRSSGILTYQHTKRILSFPEEPGNGKWTLHIVGHAAEIAWVRYRDKWAYQWVNPNL